MTHRLLPSALPTLGFGAVLAIATATLPAAATEAETPWPIAGQQGLMRFVIVPTELARDQAAYARQIALLCEPQRTCFLNFYTNTTGASPAVPLPDAIDHEATATFRRSMKQGAELMRWSCRLQTGDESCF